MTDEPDKKTSSLTSLCYLERDVKYLVLHRTKKAHDCEEGELVWLPKAELLRKNLWEGDRLFLRALDERQDFFSLKLRYEGERLVKATWE